MQAPVGMEMRPLVEEDSLVETDGPPGIMDTRGLGAGVSPEGFGVGYGGLSSNTGGTGADNLDAHDLATGRFEDEVDAGHMFRSPTMLVDDQEMVPVQPVRLDIMLGSADMSAGDPSPPDHHEVPGRGTSSAPPATSSITAASVVKPTVSTSAVTTPRTIPTSAVTTPSTAAIGAAGAIGKPSSSDTKSKPTATSHSSASSSHIRKGTAAGAATTNGTASSSASGGDKPSSSLPQSTSLSAQGPSTVTQVAGGGTEVSAVSTGTSVFTASTAASTSNHAGSVVETTPTETALITTPTEATPITAPVETTPITTPTHQARRSGTEEQIEDRNIRKLREDEIDLNVCFL